MINFNKINLGIVNIFIIQYKDGYILVDTGLSSSYNLILKKLKKRKIDLKDVNYIILTHHHYDHSGSLAKILKENNEIKLIVHEKELKALSKGKSILGEKALMSKPFTFLMKKTKPKYTNFESVFIKKGDIVIENDSYSLKKIGIDAKIIFTLGHTVGSVSILFSNGDTIVGDLIINLRLIKGYKPFVAFNYAEIMKSIKHLKELGAKILYPSHGSKVNIDEILDNPF